MRILFPYTKRHFKEKRKYPNIFESNQSWEIVIKAIGPKIREGFFFLRNYLFIYQINHLTIQ